MRGARAQIVVLLALLSSTPCAGKRGNGGRRRRAAMNLHGTNGNLSAWHRAGRALLGAFDHIWVLTLKGDDTRALHMRQILVEQLGLPPSKITTFYGASSREWGTWPDVPFLRKQRQPAVPNWWLSPKLCAVGDYTGLGGPDPPPCLQSKYERCLRPVNGSLPRVCNELCYTMSVVSALDDFLSSSEHQRALILEDDICVTPALLSATTRKKLWWLRAHASQWDLVKLADCYRGLQVVPKKHKPDGVELLTSGTCASPDTAAPVATAPPNELLPGVPWGYCTHALGVSRRMAHHIVANAFPVTDVFDSLLISHIAKQQPAQQAFTLNHSLFAQVAKTGVAAASLPKAMRSQNHGAPVRIGSGSAKSRGKRKSRGSDR